MILFINAYISFNGFKKYDKMIYIVLFVLNAPQLKTKQDIVIKFGKNNVFYKDLTFSLLLIISLSLRSGAALYE
jgi:hypothetical protein